MKRNARCVPYYLPPSKEVFNTKTKKFDEKIFSKNIKEPNVDFYFDSDSSENNQPQMSFKEWAQRNRERRSIDLQIPNNDSVKGNKQSSKR